MSENLALDVGVIVTRADHLQELFDGLGEAVGKKYGASTTHIGKLLPRIHGGAAGGCPPLIFGITRALYVEDEINASDLATLEKQAAAGYDLAEPQEE